MNKLEEGLLVIISWLQQKGRTFFFLGPYWNKTPIKVSYKTSAGLVSMNLRQRCALVYIPLGECLCMWKRSLPLIVCAAAGGGRAQLMSLSAAGWAWKRPFVGSCSRSSPCASETHSHRGPERGMAPSRLPYCPLNWHIYIWSKLSDQTHAFGEPFYPPTKWS